ncbi:MAG TPA: TRAP transporter substrate-binding protein DctP [Polyangia bacterium]|jgi:TRAP-type C4-dicarboxylate transport system substrate-binding protein
MRRALALALIAAATTMASTSARADRIVLRMATVAPDATSWAKELRAFGRDVETSTDGQIAVKWYMGGITGDEKESLARIGKSQLDGMASGIECGEVSQSMRALNVPGVVQDRDEANYVSQKLQAQFAAEAQKNGFALLFTAGLGSTMVFSRTPVRTMSELRTIRLWRWDLDQWGVIATREMGMPVQAAALEDAARMYDDGKIDGFTTMPSAALAFQWSTQAKYITPLPVGYVQGCMLLANRAWDRLNQHQRDAVMAAAAKCAHRFEEVGREQDQQLLGGLFQRQGIKIVPPSSALRAQFFEAARAARERMSEKILPHGLLDEVIRLLADYRAENAR